MNARSLISDFYARSDKVFILVRVNQTKGSTPRESGAMMLISQNALHGSVGGGRLELEAIQIARSQIEMLQCNPHDPVNASSNIVTNADFPLKNPVYVHTFSLGASLGQCCGGKVELSFETLLPGCSLPQALQQLEKKTSHFNAPHCSLWGGSCRSSTGQYYVYPTLSVDLG